MVVGAAVVRPVVGSRNARRRKAPLAGRSPLHSTRITDQPHARDSNRSLRISAIIQATFVIAAFSIGTAVLYVWLSGDPVGMISILCFILGAGIGTAVFFPLHFRYAKRKRAEFISVGGDPAGITLFMFGAMGGRRLPDGSWEWYGDHVSSGDSSSAM